jgi:hypothetical protein
MYLYLVDFPSLLSDFADALSPLAEVELVADIVADGDGGEILPILTAATSS